MQSWAICLRGPCFRQRWWSEGPQRSLPTPAIPWFYSPTIFKPVVYPELMWTVCLFLLLLVFFKWQNKKLNKCFLKFRLKHIWGKLRTSVKNNYELAVTNVITIRNTDNLQLSIRFFSAYLFIFFFPPFFFLISRGETSFFCTFKTCECVYLLQFFICTLLSLGRICLLWGFSY